MKNICTQISTLLLQQFEACDITSPLCRIQSFISPCSLLQTTPAWSSPWQRWQWLPWRNVAGVSSLKQEISSSDTDNALAFVNVTFTTGGEIQPSTTQQEHTATTHGDTGHHPYNSCSHTQGQLH